MEKQTRGFPSLMGAVLAAALQEEEDRLRRQYTDRGIAAEVSVKYDDEHMQIVYGASGSDAAEAEYGGTTRGPQALLRKGAVRGASKIQKALEKGTKA
jgi:hypothetical protein